MRSHLHLYNPCFFANSGSQIRSVFSSSHALLRVRPPLPGVQRRDGLAGAKELIDDNHLEFRTWEDGDLQQPKGV